MIHWCLNIYDRHLTNHTQTRLTVDYTKGLYEMYLAIRVIFKLHFWLHDVFQNGWRDVALLESKIRNDKLGCVPVQDINHSIYGNSTRSDMTFHFAIRRCYLAFWVLQKTVNHIQSSVAIVILIPHVTWHSRSTLTSWRLKSTEFSLFMAQLLPANNKEISKPFINVSSWWESTDYQWIPHTKGQ